MPTRLYSSFLTHLLFIIPFRRPITPFYLILSKSHPIPLPATTRLHADNLAIQMTIPFTIQWCEKSILSFNPIMQRYFQNWLYLCIATLHISTTQYSQGILGVAVDIEWSWWSSPSVPFILNHRWLDVADSLGTHLSSLRIEVLL